MSELVSVREYAEMHGKYVSRILRLIAEGRIEGAYKIGSQWVIPKDAPLPEDKRVKTGKYRNWRKPKAEE